jgi:hypothetical protein
LPNCTILLQIGKRPIDWQSAVFEVITLGTIGAQTMFREIALRVASDEGRRFEISPD